MCGLPLGLSTSRLGPPSSTSTVHGTPLLDSGSGYCSHLAAWPHHPVMNTGPETPKERKLRLNREAQQRCRRRMNPQKFDHGRLESQRIAPETPKERQLRLHRKAQQRYRQRMNQHKINHIRQIESQIIVPETSKEKKLRLHREAQQRWRQRMNQQKVNRIRQIESQRIALAGKNARSLREVLHQEPLEVLIQEEPYKRDTSLLVALDEVPLKEGGFYHVEQEDSHVQELIVPEPAQEGHCMLEPQEVIWTDVKTEGLPIKQEPMQEQVLRLESLSRSSTSCPSEGPQTSDTTTHTLRTPKHDKERGRQDCGTSDSVLSSSRPEDKFDAIAKTIADQLRSVSNQQRIYAQRLISEVLFEAELGNLNRNSIVGMHILQNGIEYQQQGGPENRWQSECASDFLTE